MATAPEAEQAKVDAVNVGETTPVPAAKPAVLPSTVGSAFCEISDKRIATAFTVDKLLMRSRAVWTLVLVTNLIEPAALAATTLLTVILTPGLTDTTRVSSGITSVVTDNTIIPGNIPDVFAQVIVVVPNPVATRVPALLSNTIHVGVVLSADKL